MSSRPAWSTERVPGQAPKLHRDTLSQKKTKTNKKMCLDVSQFIIHSLKIKKLELWGNTDVSMISRLGHVKDGKTLLGSTGVGTLAVHAAAAYPANYV